MILIETDGCCKHNRSRKYFKTYFSIRFRFIKNNPEYKVSYKFNTYFLKIYVQAYYVYNAGKTHKVKPEIEKYIVNRVKSIKDIKNDEVLIKLLKDTILNRTNHFYDDVVFDFDSAIIK